MLDPVVRVDPHDRVLHHQLWRRRYWCPVGFEHREWHPGSQRRCADVGLWETSDVGASTCLDYRNGPCARRCRRNGSSPPTCVVGGLDSQSAGEPGGQVNEEPETTGCWCSPGEGVWIESTLRCMTVTLCRVPRPRSGVGSTFRGRPVFRSVEGYSHAPWESSTRTSVLTRVECRSAVQM